MVFASCACDSKGEPVAGYLLVLLALESNTFSQDRAPVSSSQWITSRKVSYVKEERDLGWRPLLFFFVHFLRARFLLNNKKIKWFDTVISSIDVWAMKSVLMCLFCGKLLRYMYKSIILSIDEWIMALKICVADLRWWCFVDFSCGDAVFINLFCSVAVFRTPHVPLQRWLAKY